MLKSLTVKGFKSLRDVAIEFKPFTVFFGPHDTGKTNILDAIQTFARLATTPAISDALSEHICAHPIDVFSIPKGGLPALRKLEKACIAFSARVDTGAEEYVYGATVAIQPATGVLWVEDEYLAWVSGSREIVVFERSRERYQTPPVKRAMETIPRAIEPSRTLLSTLSLESTGQTHVKRLHKELTDWRFYFPDAHGAMRVTRPYAKVSDIGVLGEDLVSFLHRLV